MNKIYLEGTDERYDRNEGDFKTYKRIVIQAEDMEEARQIAGVVTQAKKLLKHSGNEKDIKDLIMRGLTIDGGHHKQSELYKLGQILGLNLEDIDEGIPP